MAKTDGMHGFFNTALAQTNAEFNRFLGDVSGKTKQKRAQQESDAATIEAQKKLEFQKAEARRKVLEKKRKREQSGAQGFGSLLTGFADTKNKSVLGSF